MQQRVDNGKIRQYHKPLNINLGMVIFGAIFVYITICVVMYFLNSKHIEPYTVQLGSLSQDNLYTGIALRDETIVTSPHSGYLNYYAREGERLGSGQLVCTVDESGQLKDILGEQNADNTAISEEDFRELQNSISSFCSGFTPKNFHSVYDFKYQMEGTVLKLANVNVLDNLSALNAASSGQPINLCYTPMAGIILYSVDGYESKTAEDITDADFDQENYARTQFLENELIAAGDPLYKLSTDENWSILIPVDRAKAAELEEAEYVKVRFQKNLYESWGEVNIIDKGESVYAELKFNHHEQGVFPGAQGVSDQGRQFGRKRRAAADRG